jgi:NADH-quinone oxidoreductase subunit E
VLAGFPDGHANEGLGAGEATLRGLRLARERGWEAPRPQRAHGEADTAAAARDAGAESPYGGGGRSGHDVPGGAGGERAGTTAGKPRAEATQGPADTPSGTEPAPRGGSGGDAGGTGRPDGEER